MALDRSKFKATSNATNVENDRATAKTLGKGKGKTDNLEIEEGKNLFRIYPPHPEEDGGGDTYAEACARVFLPAMVDDKDKDGNQNYDKKGNPLKRKSMKPIFNARVHGGFEKDLVDEYIALAKRQAEQIDDKTEKGKFLNKIYGKYDAKPEYRLPGCSYQLTWVMYADKLEADKANFGRLEIKKTIRDRMNEIGGTESSDDPLGMDPFTDVDTGLPVSITYNKPKPGEKSNPAKVYVTDIVKNIDKRTDKVIRSPLTDAQLDHWQKQTPLAKIFRNSFKKSDYELQLEGLLMFDEDQKLFLTELPEWEEIVEMVEAQFDGIAEDEKPTDEQLEQEEEKEEEEEPEVEGDQYDLMSRNELKTLNTKQKLGVVIKPSITDEQLKVLIREAVANQGPDGSEKTLPGDVGHVEEKKEVVAPADGKAIITFRDRMKNKAKA